MLSADPNGVRPALIELTGARLKEFIREPEAIFWVFGFPLLLTLLLGFAFREKPPDRIPVGIVSGSMARRSATRSPIGGASRSSFSGRCSWIDRSATTPRSAWR